MDIKPFNRIWQLSLISFILAALTGFIYRYGMLYSLPEWLNFANLRHAHSHLMFFNWVSPPIMIWIARRIVLLLSNTETAKFIRCFRMMLLLGFLSWPFFLLYGYHSVSIGPASLPLAAIISGLVMITWYWFAWLYYKMRKSAKKDLPVFFYDAALTALLISSLGAWGVSIFQFSTIDNPQISSALTHFFLAVFTEGWAVLGVLGILWQKAQIKYISFPTGWLWQPILFGSMLIFPFSLSESLITPAMLYTANIGSFMIAGTMTLNLYLLIKSGKFNGFVWKTILALILIKIIFQYIAILPTGIWPGEHGLRVLYLHLLLLGIISILFIEVFNPERFRLPKLMFTGSVLLVLLSLTMISGYWPELLTLPHFHFWVLIVAFLPIIAGVWIWLKGYRSCQ